MKTEEFEKLLEMVEKTTDPTTLAQTQVAALMRITYMLELLIDLMKEERRDEDTRKM